MDLQDRTFPKHICWNAATVHHLHPGSQLWVCLKSVFSSMILEVSTEVKHKRLQEEISQVKTNWKIFLKISPNYSFSKMLMNFKISWWAVVPRGRCLNPALWKKLQRCFAHGHICRFSVIILRVKRPMDCIFWCLHVRNRQRNSPTYWGPRFCHSFSIVAFWRFRSLKIRLTVPWRTCSS